MGLMPAFNEGLCCDIIIKYLEARHAAVRDKVCLIAEHAEHPVELSFCLGNQLFALEHTGIEPFPGHVELNAKMADFNAPIIQALQDELPTGKFHLRIPHDAFHGCGRRSISAIQKLIISGVQKIAPTTTLCRYPHINQTIEPVRFEGLPFDVTLSRYDADFMDKLTIVYEIHNLDTLRDNRIMRACEKKFPKLQNWKSKNNATTILIFENNDCQLTDIIGTTKAYMRASSKFGNSPDEVYYIDTSTDHWFASPIMIDKETYFDLSKCHDIIWKIDRANLQQLTTR